eukprot:PhF_6_TR14127/c0_g1_i3/m.22592
MNSSLPQASSPLTPQQQVQLQSEHGRSQVVIGVLFNLLRISIANEESVFRYNDITLEESTARNRMYDDFIVRGGRPCNPHHTTTMEKCLIERIPLQKLHMQSLLSAAYSSSSPLQGENGDGVPQQYDCQEWVTATTDNPDKIPLSDQQIMQNMSKQLMEKDSEIRILRTMLWQAQQALYEEGGVGRHGVPGG